MVQPTLKQKAFIKEYLRTKNITQSAKSVYNAKNDANAASIGNKTLQSPNVQNYLKQLLDDSGLSDTNLSMFIKKIITAGTSKKSLLKATPDHSLKGIDMLWKIGGKYPKETKRIESYSVNVDLKGKQETELKELLDKTMQEIQDFKKVMSKVS